MVFLIWNKKRKHHSVKLKKVYIDPMEIGLQHIVFQVISALVLLKLSGEIGRLSLHKGYASMITAYSAGNLSFNLLFRVLYMPIAISLISIGLFYFGKSYLTEGIWMIAVWYFLIQTMLAYKKIRFTNLRWFIVTAIGSIGLSYLFYVHGIQQGITALLPQSGDLTTELWIIITIFFYDLLKNRDVSMSDDDENKRYEDKYLALKSKYTSILKTDFRISKLLNDLLFSIMIFEDFNRPKPFRVAERMLFGLGIVKTTGIMQVTSPKPLDDFESVIAAQDIILDLHRKHNNESEHSMIGAVLVDYNPDAYYREEVRNIYYRVAQASNMLEEGHYDSSCDLNTHLNQHQESDPSSHQDGVLEDMSVDEITQQIAQLTSQLGDIGYKLPGILSKTEEEIKEMTAEETEVQITELQSVVDRMENDLSTSVNHDHIGKSIVFPENDGGGVKLKPNIKIESAYEVDDRTIVRELASKFESQGYNTQLTENDIAVDDAFSKEDSDKCMDLSITIQVGAVGLSASILVSLAFHGVVKGAFTEAGKDLYKAIKEKFFMKKTDRMESCFVELFVKTKERTNTENIRIYIYISNEEECVLLPDAMEFAEANIKDYEERGVKEVMLIFKAEEWIVIEGEKEKT